MDIAFHQSLLGIAAGIGALGVGYVGVRAAFATPEWLKRSAAAKPAPATDESLDATLKRLKRKAGHVEDPVLATLKQFARDPASLAPTPESLAVAREFARFEARLKRARLRREAVARFKVRLRNFFLDIGY